MQTRTESLIERSVDMSIGFVLSVILQKYILLWWFDYHVSMSESVGITLTFTVVSFIRGYIVRRAFNWWTTYKVMKDITGIVQLFRRGE